MEVRKLTPDQWKLVSENAHRAVFQENRAASLDRIDYALVLSEDADSRNLVGYLTARELDSESVYWQYGGAFPGAQSNAKAVEAYSYFLEWSKLHGYKRVSTLVENTNVRYLKLAMHYGFRIIGCRTFKNQILVELLNELDKDGEKL